MKPEPISRGALNRALLARQMLLEREGVSPVEAVDRLVGLQAQQAQPPFVGLWTRLTGFEREGLLKPLRDREVVRATMMRGTLHLVGAGDYAALRGTFQPMLTAGMRAILRERADGLDVPGLVEAARGCFGERPRTFTELRGALVDAFPGVDERAMGYAVRMHLPLVVVPDGSDWGFRADGDFATAEDWLGRPIGDGEPAETLVLRYLAAFGPAAAVDVQAWSGLTGMKEVLERLRPKLVTFRDERKRELFDLPDAPRPAEGATAPVRFLPGFDNVILAHADRSRIIADEYRARVTTKNLLVLPTFLVDGYVAGTWGCARVKKVARLTVTAFEKLSTKAKKELGAEGKALAKFIEPDAEAFEVVFEAA